MTTDLTLDALEQALWARKVKGNLIHHSDHGSQYLSIRYTERLAETGVTPSVGTIGDGYDNALAETINGFFKAEVIYREGPWKRLEAVECTTLDLGRLVQHRATARTDRLYSPGRVRTAII
jgi:putative transposase